MTNTNTNNKFQVVYKMSYAMALIQMGHDPISTMPNPQRPHLLCWVFEKTDKFIEDFNSLMKR
jgi:hypothetical protein